MKAETPIILHRDEHFLALDKTAGLASVRERWTDDDSALVVVWDLLRAKDPDARKPRVVHRLDKETSGVLLFATSLEAARSLSRQFREREVEKTYLALVRGTPPEERGRIELLLREDPHHPGRSVVGRKHGKEAITTWERTETFAGYALLTVRPRTGRMHQIRVSLAHEGYPLLVDPAYAGGQALFLSELKRDYKKKKGQEEHPVIDRVSLHAAAIALDHPISGQRIEIEAPPPKDFRLALKYLRKYRPLKERREP
jgi:23S rRNA pseudouridine955/2504/2580 synthase/23S rRNA pseudouridine1911/1915/1917 synthase